VATDLTSNIVANATSPQSTTTDGTTTVSQSIEQQVLADQYLAARAARKARGRGLYFSRLVMGGQVSGLGGFGGGFNGFV
jgi:hypothetical protein